MEKRALLAIVLSIALLLAWQTLFSPPAVSPPPSGVPEPGAPPAPGGPPGGVVAIPRPTPPREPVAGPAVEVTTPLFRATFAPSGGATTWVLHYRGTKPLLLGEPIAPLAVAIARPGRPPEVVVLTTQTTRLDLTSEQPTGSLRFSGRIADGTEIEQVLGFQAASYRIEVELRVRSRGRAPEPVGLVVYWTSPVAQPGATREAPWLTFGEGLEHRQLMGRLLVSRAGLVEAFEAPAPALKDPKESPGGPELKDPLLVPPAVLAAQPGWVAVENDYFIAALLPPGGAQVLRARARDLAEVGVVFPDARPESGDSWEGRVAVYVGPKEWEHLAAQGVGLEQAQARNYGCFPLPCPYGLPMQWFCVPLLWLMNFLATHMPGRNYGVAIILLTVVVKIVFYPLTQKSMSSMKQMQALQPQLNALRTKYKAEPQRFQREQMEIFRKHKVNPMGGCLPMVVQIPIFYALYLTLQYSVELQGAPFVLWITDLSKKDPWYVLPILMGISMLIQQKMTPTVGDPRQAKIMLIMPVVFTFMFLEFPTGLVLYWLVNNVLSIAQQYLIDRAALGKKAALTADSTADREPRRPKAGSTQKTQ